MVRLGELMMILELHRQGVSITAIARRTGRDPKTIRKYIERGMDEQRLPQQRLGLRLQVQLIQWPVADRVPTAGTFGEILAATLHQPLPLTVNVQNG